MPTTPTIAKRYYPALSSVVDAADIPDALGFIKDGLIILLSKIHYRDLQYSKSARGDAAFYSLSIVSPKRLAIEIPGTGIFLVLTPDAEDGTISSFPVSLRYEWKVLGYIRAFRNTDLTQLGPEEVFDLALMVLNVSEEQAIAQFINTFVVPASSSVTPLEQFVADINADHPWNLPIPAPTSDTRLSEIIQHINAESGQYGSLIAFATYIAVPNDIPGTMAKLKAYFQSLLPQDIEEYIKDIVLPKIRATLTLSAGIEFPRNLLQPVYDSTGTNPIDGSTGTPYEVIPEAGDPADPDAPKVMLTVGEVLFYADTEQGIGYNAELVFNTTTPAQLGNTPLIIEIQNAKLDLSDRTNLAEADADGRPSAFKGVFIEYAEIKFPQLWSTSSSSSNPTLVTRNLLVGSEGGVSGTIGIGGTAGPTGPANDTKWLNFEVVTGVSGFSYNSTTKKVTIVGKKKKRDDSVQPDGYVLVDIEQSFNIDQTTGSYKMYKQILMNPIQSLKEFTTNYFLN